MTSPAQREANRANARKSTGPRSAEGKRASRMNALRHGLYARPGLLEMDDATRAAFAAAHEGLCAAFQPQGRYEAALVRRLAEIDLGLGHMAAVEAMLLTPQPANGDNAAAGVPAPTRAALVRATRATLVRAALANLSALDRLGRIESRLQRAFRHTVEMLERRQALRARE